MTSGQEPTIPVTPAAQSPAEQDGHDEQTPPRTERLGPLPPRMNPPGANALRLGPRGPAPVRGPMGAVPPGHPGGPGGPATRPLPTNPYPTGGMPMVPAPPVPLAPPGPARPGYSPSGSYPVVPPPVAGPVPVAGPPPSPVSVPVPASAPVVRPPRQILGGIGTVLSAVLLVVVAVQALFLARLDNDLDASNRSAERARAEAEARVAGLEARAKQLEQKVGTSLDPAAVAAAVTPSVFKVIAGQASGTAFAVGREPATGGTDLVTNYHVVEGIHRTGGRDVALERDNKRFPAKIVKVDASKDLAIVHSDEKFPRLDVATTPVKPGEPILVIGAPLGLESTITTGVVSALRNTRDGQMLQFDAAINPGNSGGPVVNAQKQVVGIATAKVVDAENVGLAIPVSVACQTLDVC